jgi:CRISPR system Cascade subunit CasC
MTSKGKSVFLDVHVLQSVPPSNLNRDDSGSPKTATYGGALRARVSSQAWKRATRLALAANPDLSGETASRTRLLPQVIAGKLASRQPALADHADAIGMAAATALFNVKASKKAKKDDRPATEYLLFLGDDQVTRVVDTLEKAADILTAAAGDQKAISSVVDDLELRKLGMTGHPGAVALFGRMVADSPDSGVDAACQVAHALSTHAVISEFDYFTAVDDESPEDNKGAGMIGTVEFNSATLYRYATVDLRTLVKNLDGEIDRALDLAVAFAKTFVTCMPTGKANTFANHTRPDIVLLAIRDDQPVSLVGAFERPIRSSDTSGLMARSAEALFAHSAEQDAMYGTPPVLATATYPASLTAELNDHGTPLPASQPLPDALDEVRDALAGTMVAQPA